MIRDRIVSGCTSEKCREKLINQAGKLTMDKAILEQSLYQLIEAAADKNQIEFMYK